MMLKFNKDKLYAKEQDIIDSVECMAKFLNKNGMRYDRIEDIIFKITVDSVEGIESKIDREYLYLK